MHISYSTSILCGGQSTRMGHDKATLDWHGRFLVCHMMDGFPACNDLFLSVRDDKQLAELNVKKVVDEYRGIGPAAGLAASLKAAKHDVLFIVTCDAPLVDERTAEILIAQLKDFDAVVPVSEDHVHPLTAVYRKSITDIVECSIARDCRKIIRILDQMNVCYFPAEDLPYGCSTLANLNTPEDFKKYSLTID